MRRVILESPYAGDTEANVTYAHACLLDSLHRGEAPIASHLLYPQVLNDLDPNDRDWGIQAGYAWLEVAELMVVYTDRGVSKGMMAAIEQASLENLHVEFRTLYK